MGFVGSSTLSAASPTDATFFNIALGAVDTEQSQALPANTKGFILKSRGNALIKLSYTVTESGTKYVTVPRNAVFEDSNLYASLTLYFQSPQTGDTIEIIAFA